MAAKPSLSPATAQLLQRTLERGRAGDAAGARAAAGAGLRSGEAAEVFHALLGSLDCQAGRLAEGIAHFRAALAIRGDDIAVRGNLVRALIDGGDIPGALDACPAEQCRGDRSLRLLRLRGYLLQQSGAHQEAAAAYREIVAAFPDDFESWNNLGNALAGSDAAEEGIAAIARAAALQPGNAPVRFNHAATLVQLGRIDAAEAALLDYCRDFPADPRPRVELAALCKLRGRDAEALDWLEQAARLAPEDADLTLKLGMERQYAWQMEAAGEAFARAVALQPSLDEAHVLLALHLEHMNRTAGFAALARAAQAGGASEGTVRFLRALLCRREKKFAEALTELEGVPAELEPIRVAQLRGQCHDRLDNCEQAFTEFTQMNRLQQQDSTEPLRRAREYREALTRERELVTREWHAGWRREAIPAGRTPVFLLGFPRSGTTLLDTMLMGHPGVQVLEERPPIAKVEQEIGGVAALPGLGAADILRLREVYFAEARRWIDLREDSLLVDKFPLHLNKVPIIHRLFPEARFVLALRHPLDVLLSCYITNFRLNSAMANFLDLESAAWVYDQSFGFWEQSRQIMGVDSRTVIYERMVEDSSAALQPLFAWLGLPWMEQVLDHQRTAAGRGVITTASYAQVTEPLYTRARGRWEKYRRHLEPVIPVMRPWVERHGYAI